MASTSKLILKGFSIPIFLILLATIPFYVAEYYVSLLVSVYLYVILTVSWAMFSAPTGYMSLATATFFGIGIYTTAVLGETMPIFIVICLGGLLVFLIALLVGLACLRLRGIYFAIFTFGLTELILHSLLFYELEVTGQVGRLVVEMDALMVYYAMLFIVVFVLLTVFIFKRSKYGLALQGIGQAELAAACMGVNVNRIKIVVFALSAFFMGLAGAIMVTQWTYVDSRTAFNMFYSFMPALMALFGGARQIHGQILGAVVLTLLTETLLIKFPYYYMLMFGLLIVTIILYSPSGLVGLFESAKRRFWGGSGREYGTP
jgi:branched-chain amino acid transport system permease protein